MIDPLRMPDALRLYREIAPFVEKQDIHEDSLTFLSRVVGRMKDREPYAYIRTVMRVGGRNQDEVLAMSSEDILNLFIDGLVANQIVSLLEFGERLGFSNGR